MEEMHRTKKELSAALRSLLERKPLDQIRVRELTEQCTIRRQSFYYHFADIYQLFDWSLTQERAELLERQKQCLTWQQAAGGLLVRAAENRGFYLAVLENRGRAGLRQMLGDATEGFLTAALAYYRDRSGAPPDAGAERSRLLWWQTMLLTLVEDWLRDDLRQPPEEILKMLEQDLRDGAAGAAWRNLPRCGTME